LLSVAGCTSPSDYVKNGFKVGPDPCVPQGPTATNWIDAADVRVQQESVDLNRWWEVFQDPNLNGLVVAASKQNLSLREACFRVLEARAQLGIARGEIFPQQQNVGGSYQRWAYSQNTGAFPAGGNDGGQFFDQWNAGFNLSWELDLWGRLRRAITSAERTLDASCASYDDVLVTLLADVASNYVQVRTLQDRIRLASENVKLQADVVHAAERRFKVGSIRARAVDAPQARSILAQTEAQIPQLNMELRQACDRLCVLLGVPPTDLDKQLGFAPIPMAPTAVAVGIPCDLLRRRPDVRRAQFEALAQGERIGIAQAELYPAFYINGTLGYSAANLPQMFESSSMTGTVGPAFNWNILNYGRIVNNMHVQDARFQALVAAYQNTVLRANAEVEDGLAMFLRAQERARSLDQSVSSVREAVDIGVKEYNAGKVDYNQVSLIQQNKVQQEDLQALSHGEIAQGLIRVYRALGGGWQWAPTLVAQAGPVEFVASQGSSAAPAAPMPAGEPSAAPMPPAPHAAKEIPPPPQPPRDNAYDSREAAPLPPPPSSK
jgi:NodT family efflux transporter outer membrane factor (OMF) lipoprotein